MQGESENFETVSAMQLGKPYSTFKKVILGKVEVMVLNPVFRKAEGLIVRGDPKTQEESCLIKLWSAEEDIYFRNKNAPLIEGGYIVEYVPEEKEKTDEKPLEQYTDDELKEILKAKFFTLKNALNKTESIILCQRFLDLATEMEKSESFTNAIRARLSELQAKEYAPFEKPENKV